MIETKLCIDDFIKLIKITILHPSFGFVLIGLYKLYGPELKEGLLQSSMIKLFIIQIIVTLIIFILIPYLFKEKENKINFTKQVVLITGGIFIF